MDKLEKALQKARQERDVSLGSASFVAQGYESVSGIPQEGNVQMFDSALEENRIIAPRTHSAQADIFRLLRTQVLQAMAEHGFKTLAITSPAYGDGKTTIAINLAMSIALDLNQTILLADLDLRKPSVPAYLGLATTDGLTEYLKGQIALADCLLRLPYERMTLLPAGHGLAESSEILRSPRMGALAKELKERYPDRMIIYDMPPLLEQDDPLAFLPQVDAVLLIVREGTTETAALKRSLEILSSTPVIGIVLNDKI